MSQHPDPSFDKDPTASSQFPEGDPLERLSRGLTQWEREMMRVPDAPTRPPASADLDRLQHLLQASRAVTSTLDLNELLVRIVDAVVRVASADRGFLMLIRDAGKLHFEIARSKDQTTLPSEEFQISPMLRLPMCPTGVPPSM